MSLIGRRGATRTRVATPSSRSSARGVSSRIPEARDHTYLCQWRTGSHRKYAPFSTRSSLDVLGEARPRSRGGFVRMSGRVPTAALTGRAPNFQVLSALAAWVTTWRWSLPDKRTVPRSGGAAVKASMLEPRKR